MVKEVSEMSESLKTRKDFFKLIEENDCTVEIVSFEKRRGYDIIVDAPSGGGFAKGDLPAISITNDFNSDVIDSAQKFWDYAYKELVEELYYLRDSHYKDFIPPTKEEEPTIEYTGTTTEWKMPEGRKAVEMMAKLSTNLRPEVHQKYITLGAVASAFPNLKTETIIKILKEMELWED